MSTDDTKKAEKARKKADIESKLVAAERELASQIEMLESRIRHGQDTRNKEIDVKYAADEVQRLKNELSRL